MGWLLTWILICPFENTWWFASLLGEKVLGFWDSSLLWKSEGGPFLGLEYFSFCLLVFFVLLGLNSVLQDGVLIGEMPPFCMKKLVSDRVCVFVNCFFDAKWNGLWWVFFIFINDCFVVANLFRVAKKNEKAKEAFEKASKGQEMLSSYPCFCWL